MATSTTTTSTASTGINHNSSSSSSISSIHHHSSMVGLQRSSSNGNGNTTHKKLPWPLPPSSRPPPSRPCKKRDAYAQKQQQHTHHGHVWEDRRILHSENEADGVNEPMMDDSENAQNVVHCSSILFSDNDSSSSSSSQLPAIEENDQQKVQIMAAQSLVSSSVVTLRQKVAFDLPKNNVMNHNNNDSLSSSMQQQNMEQHISSDANTSSISSSSNSSTTHEQQHQAKRRRGGTPHRKAPPPAASSAMLGNEEDDEEHATAVYHRHYHRRNNSCDASSIILSFDMSAEEVQESGAAAINRKDNNSIDDSPRWDTVREMKNPTQQQQEYWDLLYGHDAQRMSVSASYSAQRAKPHKGCLSAGKQKKSLLRGSFSSGDTYMMMHSPMALSPSTEQYRTPQHSPDDVVVLEPTKDGTTRNNPEALISTSTGSSSSFRNNSHHRSVQFGSTTAVEYKSDDPVAKSLTPMPNEQAAALYPIDGSRTSAAEESLIQETKDNSALLAAWDVDGDETDNNSKKTPSMFVVGNDDDDDMDRPYFVATRPLHRLRRSSAFFSPAEGSRNLLGEETNTNHNKSSNSNIGIEKDHHVTTDNLASLSSLSVHSPPLLLDENGQSCGNITTQIKSSPLLVDNNNENTGGGGTRGSSSSTTIVNDSSTQSSLPLAATETIVMEQYADSANSDNIGDDSGILVALSTHVQDDGIQSLNSLNFEGPTTRISSRTRSNGNVEDENSGKQYEDEFPDVFTVLTHLAENWSGESSFSDEPIFLEKAEPKEHSWLQTFASSNQRVLQQCLETAMQQMEKVLATDSLVLRNSKHNYSHQHASLEFETNILEFIHENLTGTITDDIQASLEHVRSLSSKFSSSTMPTEMISLIQEKQATAAQIKELEAAICAEEWRKACLLHCQMNHALERRPLAEWRLQATAGMVRFGVESIDDQEVRLLFPTPLPDCPVRLVSDANGDHCQIHCSNASIASCTSAVKGIVEGPAISEFKVAREIYHALLTAKSMSLLESGDFEDVSDAAIELSLFLTRLDLTMTSLVRLLDNGGTCVFLTRNEPRTGKSPSELSLIVSLPKETASKIQLDYNIHNDPHCLVWVLPSQVTHMNGQSNNGNDETAVVPVENHQHSFSQMHHAEVCATLFDRLSTTL